MVTSRTWESSCSVAKALRQDEAAVPTRLLGYQFQQPPQIHQASRLLALKSLPWRAQSPHRQP
eukprot:11944885-Karenia_brevis.AAC.1